MTTKPKKPPKLSRRTVLAGATLPLALGPLALSSDALAQVDRAASSSPAPSAPPASAPASVPSAPAPKSVVDELKALLQKQAQQWSSGDLEGFCSHYTEDCLFLSPGGLTRGRKDVLDRYKKKYVDKAGMGTLTLDVMGASTSDALASVAMQYTLSYPDRPKATGLSLIALEKKGGRWKIAHDASM